MNVCHCGHVTGEDQDGRFCEPCGMSPPDCTCDPIPPPPTYEHGQDFSVLASDYASRMRPGGIILDEPSTPPAIWGTADTIIWAYGESLIIAGPDGVGKTTVAGQLVRGRLGIGDGLVLGCTVEPGKRNTLYLMMDRPRQARRALRRIFTIEDRDVLDEKLVIWQGPPPVDLAKYPTILLELARAADADTIIVDSLKDAAVELAKDETGSGWNRARQLVIDAGVELVELHHPRKAQDTNKKPSKLEDLYGSRWITAGAGSVISLWGEAGDLVVEFTHLKSPATPVGPWKMSIDPDAGTVALDGPAYDVVDLVKWTGAKGLTADVAACHLFAVEKPTDQQIKKAIYRLSKKVADGVLVKVGGSRGGGKERDPTRWFLAASPESNPNDLDDEQSEKQSEPIPNVGGARQSETRGDSSPLVSGLPRAQDDEPGGKSLPW